jgi:O-succinylhomoserine sulfhydrylase
MPVRLNAAVDSALRLGRFLESNAAVRWVKYPYLESHPQHELAKRQMSGGGTVVTFALNASESEAKKRAFELLDALRLVNISNNLGDSKSLITHPATTTHRAMGPEGRAAVGITDGVVRLSVGLEDTADLLTDLEQARG